ncbi:putative adhesin [Thermosporothrix hazakensis]|jgi:hypothetical protein|uniref:Putative adhesin n=1 Tax=Thermosporothrix hazakensis TaxID=644383 RepID=A0A326U6M0_THEHA|nr:DUF4097 family beta strand repeat-containing protein [Thermosporothrix hazakensis]PZW29510.1 putative adhesin [Thermosporothrix hazakensis]GCE45776.1 hypothetical protein KTH_06450 [Thermosporothrix hazakensis]
MGRSIVWARWGGCFLLFLLFALSACDQKQITSKTEDGGTIPFQVVEPPELVIASDVADIVIRKGDSNTVTFAITQITDEERKDFHITARQDGNTIRIEEVLRSRTASNETHHGPRLELTTPEHSNIQIKNKVGSSSIEQITGVVKIRSEAGAIDMNEVTLKAGSTFQTTAGAIAFHGTLDTTGPYSFETEVGSIDLTLPADSAFQLNAFSTLGPISNAFESDVTGNSPRAALTLRTVVGNIAIHKAN